MTSVASVETSVASVETSVASLGIGEPIIIRCFAHKGRHVITSRVDEGYFIRFSHFLFALLFFSHPGCYEALFCLTPGSRRAVSIP